MDLDAVFCSRNAAGQALVSLCGHSHQQTRDEQASRQSMNEVSAQKRDFSRRIPLFNRFQFHRHARKIMPEIDVAGREGYVVLMIRVTLRWQDRLTALFTGLCRRLSLSKH